MKAIKRLIYPSYRALAGTVRRLSCRLRGEIYFDKYDRDGPYHWKFYYEQQEPFYVATVDAVASLVPKHARVLDVGCGDGLLANVLVEQRGCRVHGIDVHRGAVSFAREKNHNENTFSVCSAYDITAEAAYGAAVAIEVFEHLAKPETMIAGIRRALKPGGTLVISTPLPDERAARSRYHVREYTEAAFRTYLESDFRIEEKQAVERSDGKSTCLIFRAVKT